MIQVRSQTLIAGVCFLVMLVGIHSLPAVVLADSWAPATVEKYYSPNKRYYLEVVPRAIQGPREYFRDLVEGTENPGASSELRDEYCRGALYGLGDDEQYHLVWSARFVNDVAPVTAIVSDTGQYVATFDNWHFSGVGENVVVLYGPGGKLIRRYTLQDFMTDDEIQRLDHSVSSRDWSGDHIFDEDHETLVLKIITKTMRSSKRGFFSKANVYRTLLIRRETGQILDEGRLQDPIQHPDKQFAQAVLDGNLDHVEKALNRGTDPNIPLMERSPAIVVAAKLGYVELVRVLAARNANVNAKDPEGNTALTMLLEPLRRIYYPKNRPDEFDTSYQAAVTALLEQGADPNVVDSEGWSPLASAFLKIGDACSHDSVACNIAKALFRAGADVNGRFRDGELPLTVAAGRGNVEIVRLLLDLDADVNRGDEIGRPSIIHAVENGNERVVTMLIQAGADVSVQDSLGWTALRMADSGGKESIHKLLTEVSTTKEQDTAEEAAR